jgi:hypothetical protein
MTFKRKIKRGHVVPKRLAKRKAFRRKARELLKK